MTSSDRDEMSTSFDAFDLPAQMTAFWRQAASFPLTMAVEGLRFAARRLRCQADHIVELASCEDAAAAINVQIAFLESTVDDYRNEAVVLAKETGDPIVSLEAAV